MPVFVCVRSSSIPSGLSIFLSMIIYYHLSKIRVKKIDVLTDY